MTTHPSPTVPPEDVTARLRAALQDTAAERAVGAPPTFSWESAAGSTRTTTRAHRRPAVRIARVVAPLAVAAAAAAALVLPGGGDAVTGDADPALVPVALLTPAGSTPMEPGQYRYERKTATTSVDGSTWVSVIETWQPQDYRQEWTQRVVDTAADGSPMGTYEYRADCGSFRPDGLAPDVEAELIAHACDDDGFPVRVTPDYLAGLPTDPAGLYERLRADHGQFLASPPPGVPAAESADVFTFARVLAEGANGMSQPFSAALEQAVALIPGVVVRPGVTNPDGVSGTSYEVFSSTGRSAGEMVFDADGDFIGGSDYTIEVGAADAPLEVPADLTD